MKIPSIVPLLVIFTLCVAFVSCTTSPEVIDLDDQNFLSTIAASPDAVWLVEFFAPWCGHCKNLVPIWDSLASKLHSDTTKEFRVAKIDCTTNKNVAAAFAIKGYPTIKLIKGDKMYDVRVSRTVEAFTEFASRDAWENGADYPPVFVQTQKNAPTPQTVQKEEVITFEQLYNDVIKTAVAHPWGLAVVLAISILVGILIAILCCFPFPKIVWVNANNEVDPEKKLK